MSFLDGQPHTEQYATADDASERSHQAMLIIDKQRKQILKQIMSGPHMKMRPSRQTPPARASLRSPIEKRPPWVMQHPTTALL